MAITELIIPVLKQGSQIQTEFSSIWPTASEAFKDTLAIESGCFGHILRRNQGGLNDDFGVLCLFKWETLSAFESFLLSQNFNTFLGHIGPLLAEPAKPQLFVTDTNPDEFASASVTEIIRLPVKSEHSSRDKDWERLSSLIKAHSRGERQFLSGYSINLDQQLWLGIIGWESVESRELVYRNEEVQAALRDVSQNEEPLTLLVELATLIKTRT